MIAERSRMKEERKVDGQEGCEGVTLKLKVHATLCYSINWSPIRESKSILKTGGDVCE
ncbi:MAG: hypothetical protein L3J18_00505 [Candidatus Brocadia sp.]|nr:MAG: hypothetical protein L3J18_00505 [Candidatus Brocadia sp.]